MSSRPRPTSQVPRAPVSLSSSSIVDSHATLTGHFEIQLGANSVLHPRCRLLSAYSPIVVGPHTIVHERAVVGHAQAPASILALGPEDDFPAVTLGSHVVVEIGAQVAAARVGDGCVIGAGALVREGAVLGRNCRVAPGCVVGQGEVLADGTVVYGIKGERRVGRVDGVVERGRRAALEKQVEGLRKLIKHDTRHMAAQEAQVQKREQGVEQRADAT